LLNVFEDSDATPTTQAERAADELEQAMKNPAAKSALDGMGCQPIRARRAGTLCDK